MAQHDYVIDNSTGANVRADINSALQAIVTNNSGSSAPSATFPFMLFADTSAGTMKIRNAANNGFIELFQLDGTFTLEDGSAASPALAFRDDLDTGLYSPSANTIGIATGGVERLQLSSGGFIFNEGGADIDFRIEGDSSPHLFHVDAGNNRIGIGTSTPSSILNIVGTGSDSATQLQITDGSGSAIFSGRNGNIVLSADSGNAVASSLIAFKIDGADAGRFDVNGNFIVGGVTFGAASSLGIAGTGAIQSILVAGAQSTSLIGAISGVSNGFQVETAADNSRSYRFHVGSGEFLRVHTNGFTGVGTSNPATQLDVFRSGNIVNGRFGCDTASAVCCDFKNTISSGTAFFARFLYTNTTCGSITASSTGSTAYNTSSDYRLKENEVEISDGITRLKTLKPYKFNWKSDPSRKVDGFFAHEVTAVPEAILGQKDEVATEDNDGLGYKKGDPIYQSIDHSKLVPLLVAAVKELIGKVEALEAA